MHAFKTISPAEVCRLNEESGGVVLIDVGTESDFAKARAAIARHIPLQELTATRLESVGIGRADPIFVICVGRDRAIAACRRLIEAGFAYIYCVEGGTRAWVRRGLANCGGPRSKR